MLNKIKKILSVILILISTVVAVSAKDYSNIWYVENVKFSKALNKVTKRYFFTPVSLGRVLKEKDIAAYNDLSQKNDPRLNRVIGYYKNDDGSVVFRVDEYKVWNVGNVLYIHDMRMPEEYKLTFTYSSKGKAEERCRKIRLNMEQILLYLDIEYLDAYIHRINFLVENLSDFNNEYVSENKNFNTKYNNSKSQIYIGNNDEAFFNTALDLSKKNLRRLGISNFPDTYSLEYYNLKFNENFKKTLNEMKK